MKKPFCLFLLALLFYTPANAQFGSIFLSESGAQLAIFADGFESGDLSLSDFTGDGTPNLTVKTEDSGGILKGIRVVDLASGITLWEVLDVHAGAFEDVTRSLGLGIIGFADFFGNGVRHAIFASEENEVVVLINPRDNSVSFRTLAPSILQGVTDMTGDGYDELLIFRPDTQQTEVWSIDQ